ncbi:MAG: type II toxin-antitoxin system HigB family toxin [Pseudomonadales bacterium]
MKLIGRDKLKHGAQDVDRWLCAWCSEVAHANWRRPEDVIEQFPNVRTRPGGDFLFPIGTSGYCLLLQVAFAHGIALILEMNDFDNHYGR